ncbi:MAG: DNA polymerase I [Mollicutes bacterium]|nr:DNA polymerase I [Mollicutes bacterium]
MKKVILIDGNNLLFRSYYATAYSGNMMKNSKGFPTNALYGFINMINKIINEEKPSYIAVALDKGKTFRHDEYSEYKAGRIEAPDELKSQIGVAKTLLDYLGIKYFEAVGYEADDIIGTFSQMITNSNDYEGLIVSSDKDLLQLISNKVIVKLLKTKESLLMDRATFEKEYGISPIKIIDLKSLQGDSSDNIPGVKGIGEKTALKLLQDYQSLENIYVNIEEIKGKLKDKLLDGKESAFMSKQLATIYKEVPNLGTIESLKYLGPNEEKLYNLYEELEFYSFLKKNKIVKSSDIDYKTIDDLSNLHDPSAFYLEVDNKNYHLGKILGMGIYNESGGYFVSADKLSKSSKFLSEIEKYTYDSKKSLVVLSDKIDNIKFDTFLAAYLLNYNIKDDIAYLANQLGYNIPFYEDILNKGDIDQKLLEKSCVLKAKFIYESKQRFEEEMQQEECYSLFKEIEMPLSVVLADMEKTGIKVDKNFLLDMQEEIAIKIELLEKDIYNLAGEVFNISSPKQLGEILFNKLKIISKGKGSKALSTSRDVLKKNIDNHPIIQMLLEHRMLSKIKGTYVIGMIDYILDDGKIHTIFNQTLTRTGRLSSSDPNLQNIPIRYEYGKLIRKAFLPSVGNLLMSSDYSQIELRVFAHMSQDSNLIKAYQDNEDIHAQTAMKIFDIKENEVTSTMRRKAKAVNFGILYGISSFGLSEDLDIDFNEAKKFINKYFETFPGVKKYMDQLIKDAYADGYVKTLFNRKRIIDELTNKNYLIRQQGERIALNTPIQGTSADIIKKAMIEIYNELKSKKMKSKMLLQVHDELVFDCVPEEEKQLKKLVEEIMENTYQLDVPLQAVTAIGKNWYHAK